MVTFNLISVKEHHKTTIIIRKKDGLSKQNFRQNENRYNP